MKANDHRDACTLNADDCVACLRLDYAYERGRADQLETDVGRLEADVERLRGMCESLAYQIDIKSLVGMRVRAEKAEAALRECVTAYVKWSAAENTKWHDGAMQERMAACIAWQGSIDAAQTLLGSLDE